MPPLALFGMFGAPAPIKGEYERTRHVQPRSATCDHLGIVCPSKARMVQGSSLPIARSVAHFGCSYSFALDTKLGSHHMVDGIFSCYSRHTVQALWILVGELLIGSTPMVSVRWRRSRRKSIKIQLSATALFSSLDSTSAWPHADLFERFVVTIMNALADVKVRTNGGAESRATENRGERQDNSTRS